ncbi:MAG: hypothetical protein IKJ62_02085, partial [Alphaproteobacteria bacterium]|nr:hypothetical protein [Alphaproteobacteria bacterium]
MMLMIQNNISTIGEELWRNVAMEQVTTTNSQINEQLPNVVLPPVGQWISTRELSGMYLNGLIDAGADIIGGSADLGGSTNVRG